LTSEVRVAPLDGTPAFAISPHNCFACGTLNTGGLQLELHMEAGRSWTELTLDRRFQGWDGIAHGGIICAILDEVMAWALVAEDHWGVTARMHVEFKRPVEIGRPIRGDGWVTRSRRRVVDAAGAITDAETGETLATAEGTFMAATDDRKLELQARYGYRLVDATPDSVDRA
jgi:uncharacterized protein (TIGR00369 family)